MIRKYYEFGCDYCRNGDYPVGNNIKECIDSYRENNGIITKDNLVFCNKECYNNHYKVKG